jgi:hypothetical protein
MSTEHFFFTCCLLFYVFFLSIAVQSLLFIRFNQPIDKYLQHGPTQKSLKYSNKKTNNNCFNLTIVFQIDVFISRVSNLINKFHIKLIESIINTIIYFGRRGENFIYKIKYKLTTNYYFKRYKNRFKQVEKVIYNLSHFKLH